MLKVAVLGASGMLGNAFLRRFVKSGRDFLAYSRRPVPSRLMGSCEILNWPEFNSAALVQASWERGVSVILNAVGVIPQKESGRSTLDNIRWNALFPHEVAQEAEKRGIRVIHFSTDCVFSGKKGQPYLEEDVHDAADIYGRAKSLGEIAYPHSLTLRTSIVGHELNGHAGLLEWYLASKGNVQGFKGAIYSGLTTYELARLVDERLLDQSRLQGIFQVSSDPISKYDLLRLFKTHYGRGAEITPHESFKSDKSLDSSRFQGVTGWKCPSWQNMVSEMAKDFEEWKDVFE